MEPNHERSIILRPDFRIEKSADGRSRIVTSMVDETLAVVRQQLDTEARKFRIGQYEWCEPDYQQIIIWAKALSLKPEEVVHRLLEGKMPRFVQSGDAEWTKTVFTDGKLRRLNWNFDLLPIESFEWVDGLALTHLALFRPGLQSKRIPEMSFRLPALTHLLCNRVGLSELDLSSVPNLKCLNLGWENLTTLDISSVPQLTYLCCGETQITKLDLSNVPTLTSLVLEANQLTELDLSNVPMLKALHCGQSLLTKLDLSKVPMLTTLFCSGNNLVELDIRCLEDIKELEYDKSRTRLIQRSDQTF